MRALLWALLLAVYLAVPHCQWKAHQGVTVVKPAVYSGDEPHYLLMVNSLLQDRDLRLGPDYARAAKGGAELGAWFRGVDLDHHTILLDPRSGAHELWQRVFDRSVHLPEGGYRRMTPGFEQGAIEVPAHPPAFSALVALALLPFRPGPERAEPLAIAVVSLLCFFTLLALHAAARRAGFSRRDTFAAVLLAGLCSPLLPYARSFFSEPAIALALALALWAFAAGRMRWVGAACFAAAAIKPPFGLVALGWAALLWHDGRRRDARALLEVFLAGCALLVAFNLELAHTPAVAGAEGFLPAGGLGVVGELFFSDTHGLFTFVPWALASVWMMARRDAPPVVRQIKWAAVPVVAVFCLQEAEGGGFCYGPRYFVPFLPWLALAAVAAWREAQPRWRALLAALAAIAFVIAVAGALRYRDLFAQPMMAAFQQQMVHR